jgi:Na+-driven multidrug efflux pump
MDCENWLLKDGWVGHFSAAAVGSVGWQDLLWGVIQCQVIIVVYGLSSLVER